MWGTIGGECKKPLDFFFSTYPMRSHVALGFSTTGDFEFVSSLASPLNLTPLLGCPISISDLVSPKKKPDSSAVLLLSVNNSFIFLVVWVSWWNLGVHLDSSLSYITSGLSVNAIDWFFY